MASAMVGWGFANYQLPTNGRMHECFMLQWVNNAFCQHCPGFCQLPTRRWLLVIFPVARLEKNG